MQNSKKNFNERIKWALLSVASGFLSGIAATIFLILLDIATKFRIHNHSIIWLLPIAGFVIGWVYHYYGKDVAKGSSLILEEIHDPKNITPLRMGPLILLSTVVTHLFGGSAGREGTAVQMGASLSDQLARLFPVSQEERKALLAAGAGAGFGAAIGAPWAGVIFGMEVIHVGRLRLFALFECFIASFVGYYTTRIFQAPHTQYPIVEIPSFDFKIFTYVLLAGIIFGMTAKIFSTCTYLVERFHSHFIKYPPMKPFIAGVILVILFYLEGSYQYAGLGFETIKKALVEQMHFNLPVLKTAFTSITIGSGFKGGEFVPLVFIGSTLGSALSVILPISYGLLAALGFSAVFAGAANTSIACTIMAMEIFGYKIGIYGFGACLMSFYFSGHHGIYKSQKIYMKKHKLLLARLVWLGELPKRFLSGK